MDMPLFLRITVTDVYQQAQSGLMNRWPTCLGMDGDACCSMILADHAGNGIDTCTVLPDDSMVTMVYFDTRVRVFVNSDTNIVTKIPFRG
jgi:hypothetical protein